MKDWYYADAAQQQHGPVPTNDLRRLFLEGRLNRDSLVWQEGMAQWQPLGNFEDVLALVPADSGIDLRADYAAAHTPTPAQNESATGFSPYSAPTATLDTTSAIHRGGEVVQAGFWKRVAAYFIDSFVVALVSTPVGLVIGLLAAVIASSANSTTAMLATQVISNLVSLAITAAYYAGFHSSTGQATLGKMAVGIKVVRTDGSRITLARGIGRYFATILSAIILGIGFLMAAFTERKQALHDMVCDTLVVDKWAFTAHPEWQRRELGTVTVVVLILAGLLVLGMIAVFAVMGVALAGLAR